MRRHLLLRLGQAVLVLWAAYTLTFVLLTALPGDAVSNLVKNPQSQLSPEDGAVIKAFYGVDRPVVEQYLHSLEALFHGNLGYSLSSGTTVSALLGDALPNTLALTGLGFVFGVLIAASVGLLGTYLPWRRPRGLLKSVPALAASVPSFVTGILLLNLLSFQLHLIPAVDDGGFVALLAPALTLGITVSAPLSQVFSASLSATRAEPFVHVMHAKGAGERFVLGHGVLRNSSLPVLTLLGLVAGELIAGSVVTEAVFARGGIGQVTVNAVNTQDLPVVQGVVLVSTLGYVLVNLLVDVVHPLIDPRIRADVSARHAGRSAAAAPGTGGSLPPRTPVEVKVP